MNNFVILVKIRKEFFKKIIHFLKMAEKYNFYFKQSKCDFNIKKIPILRVVVRQGDV